MNSSLYHIAEMFTTTISVLTELRNNCKDADTVKIDGATVKKTKWVSERTFTSSQMCMVYNLEWLRLCLTSEQLPNCQYPGYIHIYPFIQNVHLPKVCDPM